MGRTLTNVMPGCLNRDYVQRMVDLGNETKWSLVHIEAGKRIYQAYAELDQVSDVGDPDTLAGFINDHFEDPGWGGPWAFQTLGGAGGQTVVGPSTTGTHGGDFDRPPLADSVLAMHLVSDGGKHYWIEPERPGPPDPDRRLHDEPRVRDQRARRPGQLRARSATPTCSTRSWSPPAGSGSSTPSCSRWCRSTPSTRGAGCTCGRTSRTRSRTSTGPLYARRWRRSGFSRRRQRFLQVAVSLTTHLNFQRNLVGITKRWELPPDASTPGRAERVGDIEGFDPIDLGRHGSASPAATIPYTPDPDHPERAAAPSMLEKACADASFVQRRHRRRSSRRSRSCVASNGAVVGAGDRGRRGHRRWRAAAPAGRVPGGAGDPPRDPGRDSTTTPASAR